MLAIGTAVLLLAALTSSPLLAKTTKVDCTKSGKLQATITAASAGDTIEITGICFENVLIKDKALSLIGAASGGPHGVTGVDSAVLEAISIQNSRGTLLAGLTIYNPHGAGVRIRYSSEVSMTDCNVSDSGNVVSPTLPNGATGIWAQDGSYLSGLRLTLNNNSRGFGANQNSRAFCDECNLNGNRRGASSFWYSVVSVRDSVIVGNNGIEASDYSYIDLDCASLNTSHACSITASSFAGRAISSSTVLFYAAGDFSGRLNASGHSQAGLVGARQVATTNNPINGESTLTVEPYDDGENPVLQSRLMGNTNVSEFSHALIYGSGTELDGAGSLNCSVGSEAWVEPAINLGTFTINGC
jgi:Right handed beta helix region